MGRSLIQPDGHCSYEVIVDYLSNLLAGVEVSKVDDHIVECAECMLRVRQARRVLGSLRALTARTHAALIAKTTSDLVSKALESAIQQPSNTGWQDRLSQWVAAWQGRVQGVVQVAVRNAGQASLSAAKELADLVSPQGWEFVPAVKGRVKAAKALKVRGHPEAGVAVQEPSRPAGAGSLVVTLSSELVTGVPPLVILIDTDTAVPLAVQELSARRAYWQATFPLPAAGNFVLIIEPQGDPQEGKA